MGIGDYKVKSEDFNNKDIMGLPDKPSEAGFSAEMTVLIGIEKAELFATAHEDKDISGNEADGFSKTAHKEMDLHNNEIGRQIGQKNENLNESEMSDLIYQEINKVNSNFIWLHE